MNSGQNFIKQFTPQYFWDVDLSKLDDIKSKRLIIERVINFGSLREINLLIQHYGKKTITDVLCQVSYIEPKTLNFINRLFNIPKNSFKCYTGKPSKPHYWNS